MFWLYWWKKGASNVIFVHVRFRYCMKSIMLTLRPSYRSMEFSFNFFKEQNDSSTSSAAISQTAPSSSNPYLQLPPIQPSDAHKLVSDARSTNQVEQIDIPETPLSFQLRKVVRNSSDTSAVQIAYFKTSVTPGVYEGGFKVWECAIDLIQYLHLTSKGELWTNATVIEAGCGVGLPAIYTLQQQAQLVYFQDLNVEVLEQSTKAAVALNAKNEQELEEWCNGKAHYIAGDWDAWKTCCSDRGGVDIILSTDTLYATIQIEKLTRLIHRLLRKAPAKSLTATNPLSSPCAYVAAKRFYFGVNGGTYTFEQMLSTMPPVVDPVTGGSLVLQAETVHEIADKETNIRDILQVTWVKEKHNTCN